MDLMFNKKFSSSQNLKKVSVLYSILTITLCLQMCSCENQAPRVSPHSEGILTGANNYDTYSFNQYGDGGRTTRLRNNIRNSRATKDEIDEEEDDYDDEEKLRFDQMEAERRRIRDAPRTISIIHTVKLPEDYSVFELPRNPKGGPMPLSVHINIINILDWDELNELVHMDLELSVMWTDFKMMYFNSKSNLTNNGQPPRSIHNLTKEEIRAKRVTLNNPFILDKVWKPNLFIENLLSIKQPTLMVRPVTVRFIPEVGWFEYITRIIVKMDCEMDFHKYPADTQECKFSIRGFTYSKKDFNLKWYENGAFLNDLTLPGFDVVIKSTDKQDLKLHKDQHDDDPEDIFEVLTFVIAARRNLSYHLVQTYLASTFYIVITTLCFLLPAHMIEARIGISMTTLLTLTAMFASVRESTPIVSYVKAIDYWMVGCIFFVFLVLAQFTITTWITGGKVDEEKSQNRRKSMRELFGVKDVTEMTEFVSPNEVNGERTTTSDRLKKIPQVFIAAGVSRLEKLANVTEHYSFPLFLAIFGVYTIIYWTWLLVTADYFNWTINSTLNNLGDFSDD